MPLLEKTRADALSIEMFRRLRDEFGRGPVEFRLRAAGWSCCWTRRRARGCSTTARTRSRRRIERSGRRWGRSSRMGSHLAGRYPRATARGQRGGTGDPEAAARCVRQHGPDDRPEISNLAAAGGGDRRVHGGRLQPGLVENRSPGDTGGKCAGDTDVTDRLWKLRANGTGRTSLRRADACGIGSSRVSTDYADRAEPGTLVHALASVETAPAVDPVGQIPHWLFAFDAAGMATCVHWHSLPRTPTGSPRFVGRRRSDPPGNAATLPIHRACILESLRLWPTTPAILRDSTRPTVWRTPGGARATVPEGSMFIILTPPLHRDRDRFDFANAFTPDIWIDGRADGLHTLLPFSGGPADCPGRNVALFRIQHGAVRGRDGIRPDRTGECTTTATGRGPASDLNHYGLKFAAAQGSRATTEENT